MQGKILTSTPVVNVTVSNTLNSKLRVYPWNRLSWPISSPFSCSGDHPGSSKVHTMYLLYTAHYTLAVSKYSGIRMLRAFLQPPLCSWSSHDTATNTPHPDFMLTMTSAATQHRERAAEGTRASTCRVARRGTWTGMEPTQLWDPLPVSGQLGSHLEAAGACPGWGPGDDLSPAVPGILGDGRGCSRLAGTAAWASSSSGCSRWDTLLADPSPASASGPRRRRLSLSLRLPGRLLARRGLGPPEGVAGSGRPRRVHGQGAQETHAPRGAARRAVLRALAGALRGRPGSCRPRPRDPDSRPNSRALRPQRPPPQRALHRHVAASGSPVPPHPEC